MEAIAQRYGVGRAAVLAVKAGADMVLVPWEPEKKIEVYEAPARRRARAGSCRARAWSRPCAASSPPRCAGTSSRRRPCWRSGWRRLRLRAMARWLISSPAPRSPCCAPMSATSRCPRTLASPSSPRSLHWARPSAPACPRASVLNVPVYPSEGRACRAAAEGPQGRARGRRGGGGADQLAAGGAGQPGRRHRHARGRRLHGAAVPGRAVDEARAVLAVYSYQPASTTAAAAALFGEIGTPGRLPVNLRRFTFGHGLDPVGQKQASAAPRGTPQPSPRPSPEGRGAGAQQ